MKFNCYFLSLLLTYLLFLPIITYFELLQIEEDRGSFIYAYWSVAIATILLPITLFLMLLHLGLYITYHSHQDNHIYFITGVIPMITIFVLYIAVSCQTLLMCFIRKTTKIIDFPMREEILLYIFPYFLTTMSLLSLCIAFGGHTYFNAFWIGPIILIFVGGVILCWIKWGNITSQDNPFFYEFSYFCATYFFLSILATITFVAIVSDQQIDKWVKDLLFYGGVIPLVGLLGVISIYNTSKAWNFIIYKLKYIILRKLVLGSLIYSLAITNVFTYIFMRLSGRSKMDSGVSYGYWASSLTLLILDIPFSLNPGKYSKIMNILIVYFVGQLEIASIGYFIGFWSWHTKVDEPDFLYHFLFIFGVLVLGSLLGRVVGHLWMVFIGAMTLKMGIGIYFTNISKRSFVISAVAYFIFCIMLVCICLYSLGNSDYNYAYVLTPLLPIIVILLLFLRNHPRALSDAAKKDLDGSVPGYILTYTFISLLSTILFLNIFMDKQTNQLMLIIGLMSFIPMLLLWIMFVILKILETWPHGFFIFVKISLLIISTANVASILIYYILAPKEYGYLLQLSLITIFIPGFIYFIICFTNYQAGNTRTKLNFARIMKGHYTGIKECIKKAKYGNPIIMFLILLLVLPSSGIFLLSEGIFFILWCILFMTAKLCLLEAFYNVHLTMALDDQELGNINQNLIIVLESFTQNMLNIIFLGIHAYLIGSLGLAPQIFLYLSLSFSTLGLLNGIINVVFICKRGPTFRLGFHGKYYFFLINAQGTKNREIRENRENKENRENDIGEDKEVVHEPQLPRESDIVRDKRKRKIILPPINLSSNKGKKELDDNAPSEEASRVSGGNN